jgi:predicted metalloprotease with PDZ domain
VADLDYFIDARSPGSRRLTLELRFRPSVVPVQTVDGTRAVELFVPVWTPGSYLVREYARHFGPVTAVSSEGSRLSCEKVAKNRYRVALPGGEDGVCVRWSVYAHELSVRTADVTAAHAYWNHACLLLWPVGGEALRARIDVAFPAAWQLASGAECEAASGQTLPGAASVAFPPRSLDEVLDAPILIGSLRRHDWVTLGVPHAIVLDGLAGIEPCATLVDDLHAVVVEAAKVFGGSLPYRRYVFLCLLAAEGHGGLEHAESTTLLASRTALIGGDGYREFLALAAHELFHAWNVKRMRPEEFWRYDYERENYTGFLWLIEGWTSYYDDLLCLRAGISDRAQYLAAMAKNIEAMFHAPGRMQQSLRESSFDAWIRFYRPDENTRNSSQNYYRNGAVAAMCLDLHLRSATAGTRCLDDVLRHLYAATYGRDRGYSLADVHEVLASVAGPSAVKLLSALVDGPFDPPIAELLAPFGVGLVRRDSGCPQLGVNFESDSMVVSSVTTGTAADEGGLHPGDEVLAVEGLRVRSANWQEIWLAVAKPEVSVRVLYSRRGVVGELSVRPQPSPGTVALEVGAKLSAAQARLLDGWLPERDRTKASG